MLLASIDGLLLLEEDGSGLELCLETGFLCLYP